jgi:hypothetical protein
MEHTEPTAVVQQYISAFNKGDADGMAACFAGQGSILDGMAPHVWMGSTAPRDWYRDVLIEGEHHGASGYALALGENQRIDLSGESAYLVISAVLTFDLMGQSMETPGLFTVVLHKIDGAWLIRSWAWAKGIRL